MDYTKPLEDAKRLLGTAEKLHPPYTMLDALVKAVESLQREKAEQAKRIAELSNMLDHAQSEAAENESMLRGRIAELEAQPAQSVPDSVDILLARPFAYVGEKTAYEHGFESGWNNLRNNILEALTAAPKPEAAKGQQSENIGKFFSFNADDGFITFHATKDGAIEASISAIKAYRDDARFDGEWCDLVESVCWGVVLQKAEEVDVSEPDETGAASCDYALLPVQPPAANAAQDVRNQALEEAAKVCMQYPTEASYSGLEFAAARIRALKTAAPGGGV